VVVGDPFGIDTAHADGCRAGVDGDDFQRPPPRLAPDLGKHQHIAAGRTLYAAISGDDALTMTPTRPCAAA
jgi:hypothetical protein